MTTLFDDDDRPRTRSDAALRQLVLAQLLLRPPLLGLLMMAIAWKEPSDLVLLLGRISAGILLSSLAVTDVLMIRVSAAQGQPFTLGQKLRMAASLLLSGAILFWALFVR